MGINIFFAVLTAFVISTVIIDILVESFNGGGFIVLSILILIEALLTAITVYYGIIIAVVFMGSMLIHSIVTTIYFGVKYFSWKFPKLKVSNPMD